MVVDDVVPERFRDLVQQAVARMRLARGGVPESDDSISFVGEDPLLWLREHAVDLASLPPEAWDSAIAGPVDARPGTWWLVVDLWDPDGRTDFSLEGTVTETAETMQLVVEDVHVM